MNPLYSQVHQLRVPSTRRGLSSELLGSVEFNGFMSVVNPLISEIGRCGSTEKRPIWRLWEFLGGIPSGWGQFGAVKKWAVLIARPGTS